MKFFLSRSRDTSLVLVLLVAAACGGSSTPYTPPSTPATTVNSGPTPTPPPVASGCALGYGSGHFTCQGDTPGLLPQVDTAINKLVAIGRLINPSEMLMTSSVRDRGLRNSSRFEDRGHVGVDDRRQVQGDQLRHDESADHGE